MIYSGGAIEDELPARDLTAFTLRRAPALGDKPALIDGITGRELSYAELQRAVRAFAAGLAERGFAKGDTFAIFMPNVPEYAIAFHGALAAGGQCTTANPLYTGRELGFQLRDAGARLLLTVPAPAATRSPRPWTAEIGQSRCSSTARASVSMSRSTRATASASSSRYGSSPRHRWNSYIAGCRGWSIAGAAR